MQVIADSQVIDDISQLEAVSERAKSFVVSLGSAVAIVSKETDIGHGKSGRMDTAGDKPGRVRLGETLDWRAEIPEGKSKASGISDALMNDAVSAVLPDESE